MTTKFGITGKISSISMQSNYIYSDELSEEEFNKVFARFENCTAEGRTIKCYSKQNFGSDEMSKLVKNNKNNTYSKLKKSYVEKGGWTCK